jgi:hypothetical protein
VCEEDQGMAGVGIPFSKDLWSWRDDIAKLEIFKDSQILAEAGETIWCVLCTRISVVCL